MGTSDDHAECTALADAEGFQCFLSHAEMSHMHRLCLQLILNTRGKAHSSGRVALPMKEITQETLTMLEYVQHNPIHWFL